MQWHAYPPENSPAVRAHLGALLERQAAAEEGQAPEIMHRGSIAATVGEPLPPDSIPIEYLLGPGLIDTIVDHAVQIRALEAVPSLVALAQAHPESRPQLLGAAHEIAEAGGDRHRDHTSTGRRTRPSAARELLLGTPGRPRRRVPLPPH